MRTIASDFESVVARAHSLVPELRYARRASTPRQPTDLALFVRGPRPRGQASRRTSRRSAHSSPTRVRGCARCALAARCRLEPPNDSVWCLLPAAPCSVRRRVPTHTVSNRPTPYSPPSQPCAGVKRRFDESSGGRADDEWRKSCQRGPRAADGRQVGGRGQGRACPWEARAARCDRVGAGRGGKKRDRAGLVGWSAVACVAPRAPTRLRTGHIC